MPLHSTSYVDSVCEQVQVSLAFGSLCNCITPFMPLYGYMCASTCMWAFTVSCVLSAHALPWQTFLSLWSSTLLLLSSLPCSPPLLFSPPPPLLILPRAAIHNQDHSGRKGVGWGKTPYSFIFCPFLLLPFGLKSASIKCCRMIYGMELACCLDEFTVILPLRAHWTKSWHPKKIIYGALETGCHYRENLDAV